MRIAQIAPLVEPVPPILYGGTERVVHYLTEELVRRGHRVTLFASGDSQTSAELVPIRHRALRLDPQRPDPMAWHLIELSTAFDRARDFDLLHCHLDYLPFPFARRSGAPTLHTLHGRLDLPHWAPMMEHFPEARLVSISDSQRRPLAHLNLNWAATVYHGLPASIFRLDRGRGGYLAYCSRASREKRPDMAIEVAKRTGIPLKFACKVDPTERDYFEREIRPLLDHPLIEFIGEIGDSQKADLLGGARALLFPIDWPEPFGLAMIEAMARGTPVITRPCGSVPEIMQEGVTGFVVDTVGQMVEAVRRIDQVDRGACFRYAQKRFSVETMVDRYEEAYEKLLSETLSSPAPGPDSATPAPYAGEL
jgi:glycosyltransferase involved in cell wall biosynthesis